MAGTISLGGLASGIDTQALVSQLVSASSGNLQQMQTRASQLRAGATTLSSIGRSLAALKAAASALSTTQSVASFTASSSSSAIDVTANGDAQPGAYKIEVTRLATEQRTYSAAFAATALGQTGTFDVTLGGTTKTISVVGTDTLSDIAAKINAAGLRVTASVFSDGTKSRLQIRGLDTGAANAITFAEGNGTSLDLNGVGATDDAGKTVQAAGDAALKVDGFSVSRGTNQITGVIQGVTLTLKDTLSSPATITVASSADAVSSKIDAVVSAYNAVVQAVHAAAGYGTQKATNPTLAGDSTLRMMTDKMSAAVVTSYASGKYTTLGAIGITLARDGTMSFDKAKLATALGNDPSSVQKIFATQTGSSSLGAMATLGDVVNQITAPASGTLSIRQDSLSDQASRLDDRVSAEQARLDRYADQLKKQFTAMETNYAASQQLIAQLQRQFG
jgi:flagellar hook-associated protein 2